MTPFGGIIDGGKICGWGMSDMKEALSAMINVVTYFGADRERNFKGEIFVADEWASRA